MHESNPSRNRKRVIPVLLIGFVLLFSSLACAAIAPAATHPCCPPTGHPGQDNCLKMQCIASAPVLLPSAIAVAISAHPVAAAQVPLQAVPEATTRYILPDLFLNHHQFRV
jgi:hypothetical protein